MKLQELLEILKTKAEQLLDMDKDGDLDMEDVMILAQLLIKTYMKGIQKNDTKE